MEIYAKNKLDENMYDKMKKGADAIEIHLGKDYLEDVMNGDENLKTNVPIGVVHAPLMDGMDMTIETLDGRKALNKTCQLAVSIARRQKHPIIVVCHLETHPDVLKQLGVYDNLVEHMRELADVYPELEFAVENVPYFKRKDDKLTFRQSNHMSSVIFVKDVNHPRVGTCLDTCHALMELHFLKHALPYFEGVEFEDTQRELEGGLRNIFKANKDVVKLIHLATIKTHGMDFDHGLPFEEEDATLLNGILDLYDMYGYECPMTLEVQEQSYEDAKNFDKTNKLLRKLLEERNNK